jgi:hypothetical protein
MIKLKNSRYLTVIPMFCLLLTAGHAQDAGATEENLAILFSKRKGLRDTIKWFKETTSCDVLITSSLNGKQQAKVSYMDRFTDKFLELLEQGASEMPNALHVNVVWKSEQGKFVINNSIAVGTELAPKKRFPADEVLVFKNRLQAYQEKVATIASSEADKEIILRLRKLQEESYTIDVARLKFTHQFSSEVSSLDCHWCSSSAKCCRGNVAPVKGATGRDSCTNGGALTTNNCCNTTARYIITNHGKPLGNKSNLNDHFAWLINNTDCRDGVNSNATLKGNIVILKAKEKLRQQIPLVVGVFYAYDSRPNDAITPINYSSDGQESASNHFVVIKGYGIEDDGREYFVFYDPASTSGNNPNNKMYFDYTDNLIKGRRVGDKQKSYILTEIRVPKL